MEVSAFDPTKLAEQIMEAIEMEKSKQKKLNLMVLGKTGVGKSTLINNLFAERLADTGLGHPVTSEIKQWEKKNFPLTIYDTPGLELGGSNDIEKLMKEISKVIKDCANTGNMDNAIHCILYCISAVSSRFEKEEADFIKRFSVENAEYKIPVIIVLTKSYSKREAEELKTHIKKENLNVVQIVSVLAEPFEIDEGLVVPAFGLDTLSDVILNAIPDSLRDTFIAVQKADIKKKVQKAQIAVASASSVAAATGAIPIPVADAFLLVPNQIAMLGSITAIFGLSIEKSALAAIVTATLGTTGATIGGKTAVTSLLKLIPGAGTIIGGAISGAVAAAITAALGEAYIGLMTAISTGELKQSDLQTEKGKKYLSDLFKANLSLKRDNNGNRI